MGEKRNLRCLMKLEFNSTIFEIQTEDSILTRDIQNLRPVTLTLTRSADHEYYGSLPQKPGTDGTRLTSRVEEGGVYYFQAWNAFSLNFRDMDISPYQVHYVGKAGKDLAAALEASGRTITVTVFP